VIAGGATAGAGGSARPINATVAGVYVPLKAWVLWLCWEAGSAPVLLSALSSSFAYFQRSPLLGSCVAVTAVASLRWN